MLWFKKSNPAEAGNKKETGQTDPDREVRSMEENNGAGNDTGEKTDEEKEFWDNLLFGSMLSKDDL